MIEELKPYVPNIQINQMESGRPYSTYARGLDALWGGYQWLDRAPRGRNETEFWWRRHDEYESS